MIVHQFYLLNRYCGTNTPPEFTSSSNELFIKLHTDGSNAYSGFLAAYESVGGATPNTECGGLLTDSQGTFASPNHPQAYSNGLDCKWVIRYLVMQELILLQITR